MRIFSFLLPLLIFSSFVFAANGTMYNFGTMQQGSAFTIAPGKTLEINLYFYMDEVYGNRIAHILLTPAEVPQGWSVELDPAAHNATFDISGAMVNVTENLYIEPRPVLSTIPTPEEQGIYYLKSPSGLGYLQARQVRLIVSIPADAQVAKTYPLIITGTASYLSQTGMVGLTQVRDFDYNITVANEGYTETVVTPTPVGYVAPVATPTPATTPAPAATPAPQGSGDMTWIALIAVIVVLMGIIAALVFKKRK